jgi:hypothetical protein
MGVDVVCVTYSSRDDSDWLSCFSCGALKVVQVCGIWNHAWYGRWKTGVVCLARRWEN